MDFACALQTATLRNMRSTFHCPNCNVTGPAYYSNCPNCGCDYLETTDGGIWDGGAYSTYDNYGHDAYDEYDARKDGYPGWY